MGCTKNDILSICCKECDIKKKCEYSCRRSFKSLCVFYLKHKGDYSCIFKKRLEKLIKEI